VQAQFGKDIAPVILDGDGTQAETCRDFVVWRTRPDQRQHFYFPIGEDFVESRRIISHGQFYLLHDRRQVVPPGGHLANRLSEDHDRLSVLVHKAIHLGQRRPMQ